MPHFDRLDAYRAAIDFAGLVRPLVVKLRKTDQAMADQLDRAVLSIPCNLAEGAGEYSPGEKKKFYRYALRSATESIAILDVCRRIDAIEAMPHARARELGVRIVAMMTKLVLTVTGTGSGT